MILSNQAKCLKCGDAPWSAFRHDFRHCECGAMAVDGGMAYLRRLGNPEDIEEMSISVSRQHYDLLVDAIEDKTRNTLGHVCNMVRVLRDDMGITLRELDKDDA